jgi:protein O-GlcNAc transferase
MPTASELLSEADALRRGGRLAEAERCCRAAIAMEPDSAAAHNLLGGVLGTAGRPELAEACFRQALTCDGTFAQAHSNLGLALQLQHKTAEAVASF